MRVLLAGLLLFPVAAAARPWKPHPIKVIPGVPLKPDDIKPYVPPKIASEPPLEPSDVKVVEVSVPEATINIRPWSSPLLGNAQEGARLAVRGVVRATRGGCAGRVWYALEPFGYLCGRDAHPSDAPATSEAVLQVREGSRLPFLYVMVLIKEGDKLPMWATLDDLKQGREPERQLEKGDTVAIERPFTWDGVKYWVSVEGKVLPQKGASLMGGGSEWHGLPLDENIALPFGWITPERAPAYAAPPEKGEKPVAVSQLDRRARVQILEEREVGKRRWLKVTVAAPPPSPTVGAILAESAPRRRPPVPPPTPKEAAPAPPPPAPGELWVSADLVNEVRLLERPASVPSEVERWIDVDLGEQVLVAYEGARPVFATLVSSGRAIPTPMGTYPVWAKAAAITMKNQPYEDKGYFVNKVPWSTFFQWHNAIHGAYWHDRFGVTKSHGCVNVAPLDAKHIYEWVSPAMPPGWSGLRPAELLRSPHIVVRNSHMKKQFRQDRPIGPPDRELEAERAVEAEKRRAEAAAAPPAPPAPPAP